MHNKELRKDFAILLVFLLLAILFFWRQTIGGQTMLPADNLFALQPWGSYATEVGIETPHNDLLSDLILQNYVWKQFILDSMRARELPLWNPHILTGIPFLAGGQHSAMYPFSVLFYILPLPNAYGWYAVLHLFLAGTFTYLFARTLKVGRLGSTVAGTTFMFCGFFFIRQVFPMIVGAAVWLPLILLLIERIVTQAEEHRLTLLRLLPQMMLGAIAFGMVFLAGHPEMYYYIGLTSGFYAAYRLIRMVIVTRRPLATLAVGGALLAMVVLGVGLGSAQWVPLLELVQQNFREGSTSFEEVRGWAWPWRRMFAMFVPDFFGNPTHHTYFDLYQLRTLKITQNYFGDPINNPNWGIKNYEEGSGYLAFLPTLLAAIGLLRGKGKHRWYLALFSALSIAFVFGSPLYVLVYKLPGLSQVHSPFRWIFPYSLFMSLLAGMGVCALWQMRDAEPAADWWNRTLDRLAGPVAAWGVLVGGVLGLGIMAGTLLLKDRMIRLSDYALEELALAPYAFANAQMFYSYMFRNFLIFGLAIVLSGVVLLLRPRIQRAALWGALVVAVSVGEVFVLQGAFFPAVDPKLVAFETPAIEFLQSDSDLFRITAYTPSGGGVMSPNSAMFYGLNDIRGYDSIISKQYVDYMSLFHTQDLLLYNQIAPIKYARALDSPLLNLLNVKYVLTPKGDEIKNDGYTLVYDDEIRIYRNEDALPRAFLVPEAVYIESTPKRLVAMRSINPREVVSLEETPREPMAEYVPPSFRNEIESIEYSANQITITVDTPIPAFLVLADSYFDGWLAFIRPADASEPSLEEQSKYIYRADEAFRAVQVPAGRHVVRFKYSPDSVKYGLYISFIATILLLLLAGFWGWRRFFPTTQDDETAQRVTKNTVAPITFTLVNKVIDMAFAMLMLRILGPANAGEYYLAIVVISWFDILTNFGLNTLLTREVARDKSQANKYLSNSLMLRLVLCALSAPILGGFFLLRRVTTPLAPSTMVAIALFAVGLIPSNISAGYSALFHAYERMEIPAFVTTATTVLKVVLGAGALFLGAGYVGLAGVSIIVNLATMGLLYALVRRLCFRPHLEFDFGFQRWMLRISYPLMVNHLLATLFFKVAVLVLEWRVHDPRVVGWYSTAYKYVDAVGILPPAFTMAIFPLMSRYALESKESLLRAYKLALKLLIMVAMPGALLGWGLSHELITILGGSQYLPYAADILRVMIWYMPFGFINSVTQYVLIALDQQRFLTRAFAIGFLFSLIANVYFIDRFGYIASAYVAVFSELVLFVPFYVGVRRHLAPIPLLHLAWKPVVSAVPMALLLVLFRNHLAMSVVLGVLTYVLSLGLLRVFDAQEGEIVERVIPWRRFKARLLDALPLSIV